MKTMKTTEFTGLRNVENVTKGLQQLLADLTSLLHQFTGIPLEHKRQGFLPSPRKIRRDVQRCCR